MTQTASPAALNAEVALTAANRRHASNIIELIRLGGPTTRRALARQLGVTVPAASTALEALCAWGLLETTGVSSATGRGRRPERLDLNPNWGHALVFFPAGEQALCVQRVDWSLEPVGEPSEHPIALSANGSIQTIQELYESAAQADGPPIRGLGIVRTVDLLLGWGRDSDPVQRRQAEQRAQRELEPLVAVPAVWTHSYHARAMGEYYGGGADAGGRANFGHFYVGHGISLGLVLEGRVVKGVTGDAGEVGHFVFLPDGEPCKCGGRGCLETMAAGWALANRFLDKPLTMKPVESHARYRRYVEALAAGDRRAHELAIEAAGPIARALAQVAGQQGLDHLVLAGDVPVHAGPAFLEQVRTTCRACMPPILTVPEVALTEVGQAATAIGVAASVFETVVARTLGGQGRSPGTA
jgi:predicted NBD/HSP70 family sugar kinase